MKLLSYCMLSYIFINTSRASLFSNIKANVLSPLNDNEDKGINKRLEEPRANVRKRSQMFEQNMDKDEKARSRIDLVLDSLKKHGKQKQQRTFEINMNSDEKAHAQKDTVLDSLRRHERQNQRRAFEINLDTDDKTSVEKDPDLDYFRNHERQKQKRTFEIDLETNEKESVNIDSEDSFRKHERQKHIYLATDDKASVEIDPGISFGKHGTRPEIFRRESGDMASTSSSREFRDWKDEWKEKWIQKKYEAINSSYVPGDTVNMVGARPWGVPCGDPNQHDMPWGTCMLPMECDAEYRMYKGDYLCGRTQYICCALQLTAYDMYQGFDLSFEDSGLETDTQEKKLKGSKEDQKKHRQLMRKKRKDARTKRRRVVERQIKKIQKEIKNIIKRQERNATQMKKRKTMQLKKFYDMLKRQYQKDRKAVADLHDVNMMHIDEVLKKKLEQIRIMNNNFIQNATFREIIVNGTLNRQSARMLVEAYPELESYIHLNVKRRSGGSVAQDYLDYDVEYGMLYF